MQSMPVVRISVKGPKGEREYDAYLDTGAGRALIPERDLPNSAYHMSETRLL